MDETRDVEIFQTESDRQWQGSERSTVPEDIIKSKTASTVRYPGNFKQFANEHHH